MSAERPSTSDANFRKMFEYDLTKQQLELAHRIFNWYKPHLSEDVVDILVIATSIGNPGLTSMILRKLESHWHLHLSWLHPKCRTRSDNLPIIDPKTRSNSPTNQNERFFRNLEDLVDSKVADS